MIQSIKTLALWIAMATVAAAQTATIEGPAQVGVGRLIVLDSAGSDYTGKIVWDVDDCLAENGSLTWETHEGKLFAAASGPGKYTFKLIVSKGELGISIFTHAVTVGPAEPPPGPVQPPEPPEPPEEPEDPPAQPERPIDADHVSREIQAAADGITDRATIAKLSQLFLDVSNMAGTNEARVLEFKQRRQALLLMRPGPPGTRVSFEGLMVRWTELFYEQEIESPAQLTLFFKACAAGLLNSINTSQLRAPTIPPNVFSPFVGALRPEY